MIGQASNLASIQGSENMEGNRGQELGDNSGMEEELRTVVPEEEQESRDIKSGQSELLNETIEREIYFVGDNNQGHLWDVRRKV